jgi:diaminohydroxyphosphoribosylaminopyrimidine deaminase/5-amino-6-(5-phosphoribosylamino)uracil reductase
MVGAVVVRDGEAIASGYHQQAGGPHAEVVALNAARDGARGAELYVTLEPCSSHGRTPPCTQAIIDAGIRRCIWAVNDPDRRHRGDAARILGEHNIETRAGVLEEAAADLNRAFFCHARHGRPWVILKMAMTLDGRIATANGQSQWITGAAARRRVQRLRQWADAVLVGSTTARLDDPSLLVRDPVDWPDQPLRLVAGSQSPEDLRTVDGNPLAMATDGAGPVRRFPMPSDIPIPETLAALGQLGVKALLVEGGGELAGTFLQADCVDEVAFFIAPKILTGRESRPVVGGATTPIALDEALKLTRHSCTPVGDDYLIQGFLHDVHRTD